MNENRAFLKSAYNKNTNISCIQHGLCKLQAHGTRLRFDLRLLIDTDSDIDILC